MGDAPATQLTAWHETLIVKPPLSQEQGERDFLAELAQISAMSTKPSKLTKGKKKSKSSTIKVSGSITDEDWLELFQELRELVKQLDYKEGYTFFRLEEAMPPKNVWKWWGTLQEYSEGWFEAQPSRTRGAALRFQELEEHLAVLRRRLSYRERQAKGQV